MPSPDPSHPARLLIIRPSALGDVCRTVPVLASLRRAWPAARIDWLVQESFAPAIAAHPALDATVDFPRPRFARWWRHPGVAAELAAWLRDLGRREYDLVIDCQGLGRSGLFARMTRARRRVGPRDAREFAWLGYTHRHRVPAEIHAVEAMLALVAAEGVEPIRDLRLHVADSDREGWAAERDALGLGDAYLVLAPSARWASKRWPRERWIELLRRLRDHGAPPAVVIGAPGEEEQARGLAEAGAVDLVGRLSIGRTMAVIAGAIGVVANDSAPLHMAVGFDRPTVALFGPTDPALVGPYGRDHEVLRRCSPEEARRAHYRRDAALGIELMARITVEEVQERVASILAAAAGRAPA